MVIQVTFTIKKKILCIQKGGRPIVLLKLNISILRNSLIEKNCLLNLDFNNLKFFSCFRSRFSFDKNSLLNKSKYNCIESQFL